MKFRSKRAAREAVWDALERERVARFPFPPHGRIPNFAGAREAAERLFDSDLLRGVRRIKVNPDAPQRYVRELALQHGMTVIVATPRLRGGFREFAGIREPDIPKAASLSRGGKFGVNVPLRKLRPVDLIVVGSVAVTRKGHRCGKGEGYADIEFAILRELGHPAVKVVTTVHPLQIVDSFPPDEHDLPVSAIITPDEVIRVRKPPRAPARIQWDALTKDDIEAMPVLRELRITFS
ncbi:MAG TPA: 5-formyltetrahydrofolate cyclo-ligase [Thermoanaerobaculia bacterium]|nr:5-formyltetrahydrofolate cyclo-ligase [Thermoanaerobaculia bacterium]